MKLNDKPRYLYELAHAYNVSVETFKKELDVPELKDILQNCKLKKTYFVSIKNINRIIEHLGEPVIEYIN